MVTNWDIAVYRHRLRTMMKRLQGRLARLRDEGAGVGGRETGSALAAPPFDSADQASHDTEETVTLSLVENQQYLMEEVDAALARIEEKTFGFCERCGRAISKEELRALPYSRHCVACTGKL